MSTTYRSPEGDEVVIDPSTVSHIKAIQTLTGRSTDDLMAEATTMLRQHLVPSTKPVVTRQAKTKKGQS